MALLEANQKRLGNSINHKNNSPLLTSPSPAFANAHTARQGNDNNDNNSSQAGSKHKNEKTNMLSE